jgi:hypothetical protein
VADIKAIETHYRGHRFRSRLEARWAVFFDAAGIPWEYEPQGYVVDGVPYLPDFLLYKETDRAMWFEVKGVFPTSAEVEKAAGLAAGTGILTVLYFAGVEPPGVGLSRITEATFMEPAPSGPTWEWDDREGWIQLPWDFDAPMAWSVGLSPTGFYLHPGGKYPAKGRLRSTHIWWTDCPYCGHVLMKLHGQVGWCPVFDGDAVPPEPIYPRWGHESDRLKAAYRAARSARFEHGEQG